MPVGAGGKSVVGMGGDVGRQIEHILAWINKIESRVPEESNDIDEHIFSTLKDVNLCCVAKVTGPWDMFLGSFQCTSCYTPEGAN